MPKSSQNELIRDEGIFPIAFNTARKYIQLHHRYLAAPRGCMFCLAAYRQNAIVAVAIVNRPISATLEDGVTAEITRLCTHNAPKNTATTLLRRVLIAARALGYHRLISYVDGTHDGATYKAANFQLVRITTRHQWHGKDFCIPENGTDQVKRFELRLPTYAAAVTAVASLDASIAAIHSEHDAENVTAMTKRSHTKKATLTLWESLNVDP